LADFSAQERQILAGEYPPVLNTTHFLHKFLKLRYGERCSRCGWDQRHELTGRVPLEVEHIDGNWRNNRLENLTLLCPNCHSLTRTFRNLNRGNGRPGRSRGRVHQLDADT
jgi:predicted restriction endonuclease